MNPYFLTKRWYWIFQVIGWTAFLGTQVQASYMLNRYTSGTLLWLIIEATMGVLLTHGYRALLLRSGVLRKSLAWQGSVATLGLLSLSLSIHTLSLIGYALLQGQLEWLSHQGGAKFIFGVTGIGRYVVVWLLAYHFFVVGEWLAQAQIAELRAISVRRQAELDLLRSQINPHFLFNVLNSVRSLTLTDPHRARAAINQLVNLFRHTLRHERSQLVSLNEELSAVRAYLSLEQIRFGTEHLRFALEVPMHTLTWSVPAAVLLTLVENAVKHGFNIRPEGGELHLQASTTAGNVALCLVVQQPGRLAPFGLESAQGIGLRNARERLGALYGKAATLTLEENPSGTVTATLQLPARPSPPHFYS